MTTATFQPHNLIPSIKVNGRNVYVNRITEITQTRKGHFEGIAYGSTFKIEGGKAAGGTSRDWFVEWDQGWNGSINATSLVDAIKLIEGA